MLFQRATTVLQTEKRLTCSTDTNLVLLSAIKKKKKKNLRWEKMPGTFFFFYLFIYFLAKRTALQKSNKIYFPVGSVLRVSS